MHMEELNELADLWRNMQVSLPRLQSVRIFIEPEIITLSIPYFQGGGIVGRFPHRESAPETLAYALRALDDRVLRMAFQAEPIESIIDSVGGHRAYFTVSELVAVLEHGPNAHRLHIKLDGSAEVIKRIVINEIEYWVYNKMIIKPCDTVWKSVGYKVIKNGEEFFLRKDPREDLINAGYFPLTDTTFQRDEDIVTLSLVEYNDGEVTW